MKRSLLALGLGLALAATAQAADIRLVIHGCLLYTSDAADEL